MSRSFDHQPIKGINLNHYVSFFNHRPVKKDKRMGILFKHQNSNIKTPKNLNLNDNVQMILDMIREQSPKGIKECFESIFKEMDMNAREAVSLYFHSFHPFMCTFIHFIHLYKTRCSRSCTSVVQKERLMNYHSP